MRQNTVSLLSGRTKLIFLYLSNVILFPKQRHVPFLRPNDRRLILSTRRRSTSPFRSLPSVWSTICRFSTLNKRDRHPAGQRTISGSWMSDRLTHRIYRIALIGMNVSAPSPLAFMWNMKILLCPAVCENNNFECRHAIFHVGAQHMHVSGEITRFCEIEFLTST